MTSTIGKMAQESQNYVPTFRTIAGLSLSADISAQALGAALGLASVAFSGQYSDLLGAPDLTSLQSNWAEADTTSASYIKNKPNLSAYQTVVQKASAISPSSPSNVTNYPTVSACLSYFFPFSGGTFTGMVKAHPASQSSTTASQFRNIRFVEGETYPDDVQEGELVCLWTEASQSALGA